MASLYLHYKKANLSKVHPQSCFFSPSQFIGTVKQEGNTLALRASVYVCHAHLYWLIAPTVYGARYYMDQNQSRFSAENLEERNNRYKSLYQLRIKNKPSTTQQSLMIAGTTTNSTQTGHTSPDLDLLQDFSSRSPNPSNLPPLPQSRATGGLSTFRLCLPSLKK